MKKIKVTNFRGIKELEADLSKLNIITASNGSGKSSFIDAINWMITGIIHDEDIRHGENEASVEITFDSGNSLKRKRKAGIGCCYANDKKISEIVLKDMLKNELNCSLTTATAVCGTDFLDGLNKKDLTSFLLSILPITVGKNSIIPIVEETLKKNLLPDEKSYLETLINKDVYTLDDFSTIYSEQAAQRKVRKQDLATIKTKATFDMETLPAESKESLNKALEEIVIKEANVKENKKSIDSYKKAIEDYNKVNARKIKLEEDLKLYADIEKPNADITTLEKEKKQFQDAITKHTASMQHNVHKLDDLANAYRNLQNPICPFTKEACSADLTPYKEKIANQGREGKALVDKEKEFISRCQEQINMRDEQIKDFNDKNLKWTKKEALLNELNNMVIPTVPEQPIEIKEDDLKAKKDEINNKLSIISAYEASQEYNKQIIAVSREVEILDLMTKLFDVKGIKSTLLKKSLKPVEDLVNKISSNIKPGFKISLVGVDGLDVNIYPDGTTPVPIDKVSSGEFILTAYLIMGAIHDITRVSFLVIDDMDRLDKENASKFMRMIEADQRFKNVILAGVNHDDFTTTIPDSANIINL